VLKQPILDDAVHSALRHLFADDVADSLSYFKSLSVSTLVVFTLHVSTLATTSTDSLS